MWWYLSWPGNHVINHKKYCQHVTNMNQKVKLFFLTSQPLNFIVKSSVQLKFWQSVKTTCEKCELNWFIFPISVILLGRSEHSNHTQVWTKTTAPRPFEDMVSVQSQTNSGVVCFWWEHDDVAGHSSGVSSVFMFLLPPQTHVSNEWSERSLVACSDAF